MSQTLDLIIISISGLAIGSFINALVWRIHKSYSSKRQKKYSLLTGRSMCPKCEHQLEIVDLVPLISWLYLRGRCRYCHKQISAIYPLVEALTTVIFVLTYVFWQQLFNGQGIFDFVFWLIILTLLIALAIYDLKWMLLPNKIIYPLAFLVFAQVLVTVSFFHGRTDYLFGDLLGMLIGCGVFYVLFQLSSGKWIGGGDVKLGAILGLYLGSGAEAILMIFFASVIGSLYSVPMLAKGKMGRKTVIPYGPFLIVAVIILRLCGSSLLSWLRSRGVVV